MIFVFDAAQHELALFIPPPLPFLPYHPPTCLFLPCPPLPHTPRVPIPYFPPNHRLPEDLRPSLVILPPWETHIREILTHIYIKAHPGLYLHTYTNTNLSASSLYPPSPFFSQMCPIPWENPPLPQSNKIKSGRLTPRHPPAPFWRGEDELMNVVGQMRMRGEQLKSLLSFSLQIQREYRETEIVSGMKKKISYLNQRNLFWRLNKDKRTTGFYGTHHMQNQGHWWRFRTKHKTLTQTTWSINGKIPCGNC